MQTDCSGHDRYCRPGGPGLANCAWTAGKAMCPLANSKQGRGNPEHLPSLCPSGVSLMFHSGKTIRTGHLLARTRCLAGCASPATAWFAVRAASGAVLLVLSIAGLYLVKSALRIDILPGPSPLHDLLYPIIELLR